MEKPFKNTRICLGVASLLKVEYYVFTLWGFQTCEMLPCWKSHCLSINSHNASTPQGYELRIKIWAVLSFILWSPWIDTIQIVMVLLIVMCSILILNHELICGPADRVFLVYFLRQISILYLHSYLRLSQGLSPVQTVSSVNHSGTISYASTRHFLSFWRDNWKSTWIWGELCMCIKDSVGI